MDWNNRASSMIVYEAAAGLSEINSAHVGILGEGSGISGVRGIGHAVGHGANPGAVVGLNDNSGLDVLR
jgi:hypothetical protein